jgi:hypothetical protein
MKGIKIFGLPRSCTNLTTVLLRTNFLCPVFDNYPCWKHGPNCLDDRFFSYKKIEITDLRYVVCTKNPYDWLWSLFCFENETKINFKRNAAHFLTQKSWHYKDMTPIEAFNKLNKHWLTISKDKKILQQIKYEDMANNQLDVLFKIQKHFDLEMKKEKLEEIKTKVAPKGKITEENFKYRKSQWSKEEISFINKKLDKNILNLCNYRFSS